MGAREGEWRRGIDMEREEREGEIESRRGRKEVGIEGRRERSWEPSHEPSHENERRERKGKR